MLHIVRKLAFLWKTSARKLSGLQVKKQSSFKLQHAEFFVTVAIYTAADAGRAAASPGGVVSWERRMINESKN